MDNTRWRTAKERLAEAEVLRWNGGVYVEAGIGEDCWARTFGNLQRREIVREDSTEKEEMKRQQRMKVMKDRSKGRWTLKTDGGLLSCWWQTARKRGSIQKKKRLCNHVEKSVGKRKRKWWKKNGTKASTKGESDVQECGRQCWTFCTKSRSPQHGEKEHRS